MEPTSCHRHCPMQPTHMSLPQYAPVALLLPDVNADASTLNDLNPLYSILGRAQGTRVRSLPQPPRCNGTHVSTGTPEWEACACSVQRTQRCRSSPDAAKELCCRGVVHGPAT